MNNVTAIIPTLNEETNIKDAIESCLFADEIIIVDSFSTDKTQEISLKYSKVKFLVNKFEGHGPQKNWAIDQATNDWVFILDADERTSDELIKEIKLELSNPSANAYSIGRVNYFMDKKIQYVWSNDSVIRLFNRKVARYDDKFVHEKVVTSEKVKTLNNTLKHDTYFGKGLIFHLQKGDRYSTLSAKDKVNKIDQITMYHLLIKPFFGFIKRYILKRGFMDGKVGFIISCFGAWNIFIRNVKIMRMHKGEEIK